MIGGLGEENSKQMIMMEETVKVRREKAAERLEASFSVEAAPETKTSYFPSRFFFPLPPSSSSSLLSIR